MVLPQCGHEMLEFVVPVFEDETTLMGTMSLKLNVP